MVAEQRNFLSPRGVQSVNPQPTDDELIDAALRGEVEAFGHLVRRYQDRLFQTLCQVVQCDDDARDVAQDAFVQAFVKLETFERKAGFYTWLYRIALNMAATRRRRTRPSQSLDRLHDDHGSEPTDRGEAPESNLDRDETVDQVQRAIAKLPEEFRTALVLREIEGFDYDTIARMLEVPVGTVRSRLHRARLQLRGLLQCAETNATAGDGQPTDAPSPGRVLPRVT